MNWGIVGIGHIAGARVAPAIARDPDSQLVAVSSRSLDRAEAFAQAHGVARAYGSYDAMLADADVDAVIITTPNALHAQQVIAAAAAGKHVLCDKPLATNIEDAKQAIDACHNAGVKLGMNFEFRHAQGFIDIRDAIRAGAIGDVHTIQIDSCGGVVPHVGWRADPSLAWLGATANVGVHLYDVLRFVLDAEVTDLVAMLDVGRLAAEQMETISMVLLRFDNGALAQVVASQRATRPLNDVVIHGSRGRIDSRGIGSLAYLLRSGTPLTEVRVSTEATVESRSYDVSDVFERTISAFAQAVGADIEPAPSGADGLISVQLMDAVVTSARNRVMVSPGSGTSAWQ